MIHSEIINDAIEAGPLDNPKEGVLYRSIAAKSRNVPSFNDLNMAFMCAKILDYEDSEEQLAEYVIDFHNLDYNNFNSFKYKISIICYTCINEFIKNPATSMMRISRLYDKLVGKVDLNDENISYMTSMYISMMSVIEEMLNDWANYEYVSFGEKTWRSYGRYPRLTYGTCIDLFSVDKDGKTKLHIISPSRFTLVNKIDRYHNIRVLHLLDHFRELGIRIDKVCRIDIPFYYGEKIIRYEQKVVENEWKYSERFFKKDYTLHSNPSYCVKCPYYTKCSGNDLFSKL